MKIMSIEVKQMIIKSTVVNESFGQQRSEYTTVDIEQLKAQVMQECKVLIAESLNELQER